MYDGSVRNPKELTDMQRELDHFKAQRGKLDDEGLELIEAIEETTRLLSEHEGSFATSGSAWQGRRPRSSSRNR